MFGYVIYRKVWIPVEDNQGNVNGLEEFWKAFSPPLASMLEAIQDINLWRKADPEGIFRLGAVTTIKHAV